MEKRMGNCHPNSPKRIMAPMPMLPYCLNANGQQLTIAKQAHAAKFLTTTSPQEKFHQGYWKLQEHSITVQIWSLILRHLFPEHLQLQGPGIIKKRPTKS